ncbi:MAG: hypothetical protein ACFB16_02205 [Phormidesmis sp.]
MTDTIDLHDDTERYNTVGWEADGLFRLTTQLVAGPGKSAHEREIDIDDREAYLLITLEMASAASFQWKATNVELDLIVDSTGENTSIAIEGTTNGTVPLVQPVQLPEQPPEIFPGGALYFTVKVETGLFSSPTLSNQSAKAGVKNFPVKLKYDLEPLVGPPRQQTEGQLIFFVAED